MLSPQNTGLLIIDVQGKLARSMLDSETLLSNLQQLIEGCKMLNLPIVWLEQTPLKIGETVTELKPLLKEHQPLAKYTFNGCEDIHVMNAIASSSVQQWLVCGIEAHICVYQTALDLVTKGYNVEVVSDCVSSRSKFNLDLALQKMQLNGVGLTSVEMCFFELMGNPLSEEFKKILTIIK